jgi:hypothetical protein
MPRYYYGTIPALAWIINHYFYSRTHYAWLAAAFHPHGQNPGSSNPYKLYALFYEPWAERDSNSHFIDAYRDRLIEGVLHQERVGVVESGTAARLMRVCELVSVDLFYPVLYRVNIDSIPPSRRVVAKSALEGSREFLVTDLRENEFDLLFTDNARDEYFARIVLGELEGGVRMHPMAVLTLLETKVDS